MFEGIVEFRQRNWGPDDSGDVGILLPRDVQVFFNETDDFPTSGPLDLKDVIRYSDSATIEHMINSVLRLMGEHDQIPEADFEDDRDQLYSNHLDALIANILESAVSQDKLDSEKINGIIAKINEQYPDRMIDLDNIPVFNVDPENANQVARDIEKRKEQLEKERERKLAQREAMREEADRIADEIKKRSEEAARQNRIEAERRREEAEQQHRDRLSEEERQRLEERAREREQEREQREKEREPTRPPVQPSPPKVPEQPTEPPKEKEDIHWVQIPNQSLELAKELELTLDLEPKDAQIKATSSDEDIVSVRVVNNQLEIEAIREGEAQVELEAIKEGYKASTISFSVKVNTSNSLPIGKSFYIPENRVLTFENGIVLDLREAGLNKHSKITVNEIDLDLNENNEMQQAGPVVDILFEQVQIDQLVPITFPVEEQIDLQSIGVFIKQDNDQWRYQSSVRAENGLQLLISEFSNLGMFKAPRADQPIPSINPGEVPVNTEISLQSEHEGIIYYTKDGSDPTTSSHIYREPITIDEDMVIKTRVIAENMILSEIATFAYSVQKEHVVTIAVNDGTKAIKNAEVELAGITQITDASGEAEFSLLDGSYQYRVVADGFEEMTGTVEVQGDSINLAVTLTEILGTVVGQVAEICPVPTCEVGSARPTSDTAVNIYSNGHLVSTGRTDQHGHFEINNVPVNVDLIIKTKFASDWVAEGDVELTSEAFQVAPNETKTVNLTHRPEVELEKFVVFNVTDGVNSIEGATVNLGEYEANTDADGRVRFKLYDGDYEYLVNAAGYVSQSGSVSILGDDLEINIELKPETGTLTGQVLISCACDLDEEELPLSDVLITVFANDKALATSRTDQNGQYVFEHVPANQEVVIIASYENELLAFELSSDILYVSADEILEWNFDYVFEPVEYTVTFIINDGNDKIENAKVTLTDVMEITDRHGIAQFSLVEGVYNYSIKAEGYEEFKGIIKVQRDDLSIDITLKQLPGAVKGQLIEICPVPECNLGTNSPIHEAQIIVLADNEIVGEGWSDEDGNYQIDNLPAHTDLVLKARFESEWVSGDIVELVSDSFNVSPGKTIAIDFMHQPEVELEKQLTITVKDGENPLEGAEVHLGELIEITNQDGQVSFLLLNGEYDYKIIADGYYDKSHDVTIDGEDLEIVVQLETILGTINGQVIEVCPIPECDPARPDPVSEVYVEVYSGDEMIAGSWTDAEGRFSIVDLPVHTDLKVIAHLYSGWADDGYIGLVSEIIRLIPGETETINLIHEPEIEVEKLVSFTITDGERPIENATVYLYAYEGQTDINGQVSFELLDGHYEYLVSVEGYIAKPGSLVVEGDDIEIELQLEKETGLIAGQVLLSYMTDQGVKKLPLADVFITVMAGEEEIAMRGTNEDGRYEIDGLPVHTDLIIIARFQDELFEFEMSSQVIQIDPGSTVGWNFEYFFEPKEHTVTFALNDDQSVIEHAQVIIKDLKVLTDSKGEAQFLLQDGIYDYTIVADGYQTVTGVIKVKGGDLSIDINLKFLPGTVNGQVIEICPVPECDPARPDPVEEVYIEVYAGDDVIAEGWTNEDGQFEITDLPVHTELKIIAHLYSGWVSDGYVALISDPFQIEPGKTVTIDLIHEPEVEFEKQVTFIVTDGENPIENTTIYLGESEDQTDADGRVSFYLYDGFYEYLARAEGYNVQPGSLSVEGNDFEVEVELALGFGSISGGVFEICPLPECDSTKLNLVPWVNINVYSGEERIADMWTDDSGYFEISDLPVNTDLKLSLIFIPNGLMTTMLS